MLENEINKPNNLFQAKTIFQTVLNAYLYRTRGGPDQDRLFKHKIYHMQQLQKQQFFNIFK